jgi:putative ABC transport system permease protein
MLLQIASAFLLFGLLQGLSSGVEQAIAKTHADRLYVRSAVSGGDTLPVSLLPQIKQIAGVKAVTSVAGFAAQYQRPDQTIPIAGIDAGDMFKVFSEFVVDPAQVAALKVNRAGGILGSGAAKRYGLKVGDRITLLGQPRKDGSNTWTYDIVGTFDQPGNEPGQLFVNYDSVNEARFAARDTVLYYVVVADSVARAGEVGLAIDNAFASSPHPTRTLSEGDLMSSQIRRIADLDLIVRGIIGAVFFGLLFATSALMMQSMRERTPELAVLKAVGFSDALVMTLILTEAIVFCLFSAAVGLGIASVLLPEARVLVGIAAMPGIVLLTGAGFALLLALIGSAAPAWRGLKLQVATALTDR